MRSFPLLVSILLSAVPIAGAQEHQTESRMDGFLGPVQSVSTRVELTGVGWPLPGAPPGTIPVPVPLLNSCYYCTYDIFGNRTERGTLNSDGQFHGEIDQLVRGGDGHVIARTVVDSDTDQVTRSEWLGPFGPTDTDEYQDGARVRTVRSVFDHLGHLTEATTYSPDGSEEYRVASRYADDGTKIIGIAWNHGGQLNCRETYDPETDFERYETFDPSGAVQLTWTVAHGKLLSFWTSSDEPIQLGSQFSLDKGGGIVDHYFCRKGGCDVFTVHSEYADSTKRNPTSIEWRDSEGRLVYAANYEYEFDAHKNWTHRKIWLTSPEVPNRTLYETDSRTILYWPK